MPASIKVIIVGASGRVGPAILGAIDADPRFQVSVLSRASSPATFPSHIQVYRVDDDYSQEELVKAFEGQDVVVSTLATAAAPQQKKMIDAAVEARVRRFIPSEFGSDVRNQKALELIPQFFQGKVDTVEYLKTKESEGLSWTTFVTGSFFELAIKIGYMGFDLRTHKATLINEGEGRWSTTTLPTIGLAVKNAILDMEGTANQIVYVASFTVSQKDVLAALERLTDSTWAVTKVDGEQQKDLGREKFAKGDLSGAPLILSYINCVEGHGGDFAMYRGTWNDHLGLPKESLYEALKIVLAEAN